MASLVSPGVSVTITDESFFIPAAGSTVPLFFITTSDQKVRPNGLTAAAGTYEHNVIRTVTSLKQSTDLYGIPSFLEDTSGAPLHGDARNEYGVFALNQALGVISMAYVVRANVNLNDSIVDIRSMWDTKMQQSTFILENLVSAYITDFNASNGLVPASAGGIGAVSVVAGTAYTNGVYLGVSLVGTTGSGAAATVTVANGVVTHVLVTAPGAGYVLGEVLTVAAASVGTTGSGFSCSPTTLVGYKSTIDRTKMLSLVNVATNDVWMMFSFRNSKLSFINDSTLTPAPVYARGYSAPSTDSFIGLTGLAVAYETAGNGSVVPTQWTAQEAGDMLMGAADAFKYTILFRSQTSLGANDAARRVAIVTALQESINSNTDIRSEAYEYNLVLCPGFHEVGESLLALIIDIKEEAFIIADTPFELSPDDVAQWGATVARTTSRNVAYYYPHGVASNLNGKNVFIAASGVALRTYGYSDSVAELWSAPAGTRRGLVSGLVDVGYVSGTLGTPTTFVPTALNQGQRDNLYKYFTNINPIVFYPGRGILVWGQKTSAPDASAMDRVNVVRLLAYIKRQLRKNTMSFVFEPNDQLTRDNLKAVVDGFLGGIMLKRGLYDFATICDKSNNTPSRIDANELYIDIALKPTRTAEFINIPIRVLATGAQI